MKRHHIRVLEWIFSKPVLKAVFVIFGTLLLASIILSLTTGSCWLVNLLLALCAFYSVNYGGYTIVVKRIDFDRTLSDHSVKPILLILLFIISIPLLFGSILSLFPSWINESEMVYAKELYYGDEVGDSVPYYSANNSHAQSHPGMMWSIWYHFIDPGNLHMTTSRWGRSIALILGFLGSILLTGVFVSSITNYLSRIADNFKAGTHRYKRLKWPLTRPYFSNHTIIMGDHLSMLGICRKVLGDKTYKGSIFILTTHDLEELRSQIRSNNYLDESRIILYRGKKTNLNEIQALYPQYACAIYILGNDNDTEHSDIESLNCFFSIVNTIKVCPTKETRQIPCYTHIYNRLLLTSFLNSMMPGLIYNKIAFYPYNYYDSWAKQVLVNNTASSDAVEQNLKYTPIDGSGIGVDTKETVHVIVMGMSEMGIAYALQVAQIAHYPNFVEDNSLRTRITLIDAEANQKKDQMLFQYKHLFSLSHWRFAEGDAINDPNAGWHIPEKDFLDIEWEFLQGVIEDKSIQTYLEACALDTSKLTTIAICYHSFKDTINSTILSSRTLKENVLQILVFQEDDSSVVDFLNGSSTIDIEQEINSLFSQRIDADVSFVFLKRSNMQPFGMNSFNSIDDNSERQAMLLEAAYRYIDMNGYCFDTLKRELAQTKKYISLEQNHIRGDLMWSRWSNLSLANHLPTKHRSFNASASYCSGSINPFSELNNFKVNIDDVFRKGDALTDYERQIRLLRIMAEVEQNRWNMEKLLIGYRPTSEEENNYPHSELVQLKYGPERAHFYIRPFEELFKISPKTLKCNFVMVLASSCID